MAKPIFRIGTRDSQLAVWQATLVQNLLKEQGIRTELIYLKSEGDLDTVTPIYKMGVQGVFTKTLDAALLNDRIDVAVHSMKDVPTQLAQGIQQAAVLKRGSHKDILVAHPALPAPFRLPPVGEATNEAMRNGEDLPSGGRGWAVATSSIRRIAQWLYRYPNHKMVNLRGNVNTRLQKLKESEWHGAIFAEAGLERIGLRPGNAIELDWMLPAPAQGAIMAVCREDDNYAFDVCQHFNNEETALCTKIEREFLSVLMGGCSTPISALAKVKNGKIIFKGNIASPDGSSLESIEVEFPIAKAFEVAALAAKNIVSGNGQTIMDGIRKKGLTADGEV